MKVLEDWTKQLKISKYILLAMCSLQLTAIANDDILSNDQLKSIDFSFEKIQYDSAKQKIDWINPVYLSHDSDITAISINQPIFKSGGIYNAIKYANISKKYQSLDISIQKKMLIKDATSLLYELNKIDLSIKKQMLLIQNSKIDIKQKKEQVNNHILDLSFLNDAIIKWNQNRLQLINLNIQKDDLLNQFNSLTNKNYKNIQLPILKLLNKDMLIQNNLYIKKSILNEKSSKYLKNITLSKYLPSVSLVHDHIKYDSTNQETTSTQLKLTIPLDVKSYYDTQSAKISYLKSKLDTKIVMEQEQNYIKYQLSKISSIDQKINIQQDTIKYYINLIDQMVEERNNGLKVDDDVTIIKNSKKIAQYDLEIFKLDKQIKLLEIYARTN
jgi:hypothetical protein